MIMKEIILKKPKKSRKTQARTLKRKTMNIIFILLIIAGLPLVCSDPHTPAFYTRQQHQQQQQTTTLRRVSAFRHQKKKYLIINM